MSAFETTIRLQLDKFSPAEAQRRHVAIARAGLNAYLASQPSAPDVTIEVDGHHATSETEVRPFGIIVYRFSRMREIAGFALAELRRFSPIRSGRYRDAWFVMLNDAEASLAEVGSRDTVTLANDEPYSRKINVGAKGFTRYAPPGVVEKARQSVLARYRSSVEAEIVFLTFGGGWVLRKSQQRKRKGRPYGGFRSDALKGMQVTYPALVLKPKYQ